MDSKKEALRKADELLKSTSAENRLKFEAIDIEGASESVLEESDSAEYSLEINPIEPLEETELDEPVASVIEVQSISEDPVEESEPITEDSISEDPVEESEPTAEDSILEDPVEESEPTAEDSISEESVEEPEPAAEEAPAPKKEPATAQQQELCIIDETSTSVVIEQGSDLSLDEIVSNGYAAKAKKPKQPIKLKPVQIILIVVAGLIALWCLMFTVDHTLAANGISPIFCIQTEEYPDGSGSYKGLGYKVQFKFDENGNLTQKVLPAWQDGPNDYLDLPQQ